MKGMRPPHASCRKFPPSHVQSEDYFRGRFSTRTVLCFSRSKLGILMIPRLPDVKPPCLTRRALGPGVFFWQLDSPAAEAVIPIAFEWDVLPLVGRSPQAAQAIDVEGFPSHMYFQANQDDVLRSPPSHPALGSAHD